MAKNVKKGRSNLIKNWTTSEACEWLWSLGQAFGPYEKVFRAKKIDGRFLYVANEDDIAVLISKPIHQKRVWQVLQRLQKTQITHDNDIKFNKYGRKSSPGLGESYRALWPHSRVFWSKHQAKVVNANPALLSDVNSALWDKFCESSSSTEGTNEEASYSHSRNADKDVARVSMILNSPKRRTLVTGQDITQINRWDEYLTNHSNLERSTELQTLIRDGIPEQIRGIMWPLVCGSQWKQRSSPRHYYDNLARSLKEFPPPSIEMIDGDIERLAQQCEADSDRAKSKFAKLRRVVCSYLLHNKSIQYSKFLVSTTALLLFYCNEEGAFWLLDWIMTEIHAFQDLSYSSEDSIALQINTRVLQVLVQYHLPQLSNHLYKHDVSLATVVKPWFVFLFVNSLPLKLALRVWDVMFSEGVCMMFAAALSLLRTHLKSILSANQTMDILHLFHLMQSNPDVNEHIFLNNCYVTLSTDCLELSNDDIYLLRSFHHNRHSPRNMKIPLEKDTVERLDRKSSKKGSSRVYTPLSSEEQDPESKSSMFSLEDFEIDDSELPDVFQDMNTFELMQFCFQNNISFLVQNNEHAQREELMDVLREFQSDSTTEHLHQQLERKQRLYKKDSKSLFSLGRLCVADLKEFPKSIEKTDLIRKKERELPGVLKELTTDKCHVLCFGDVNSGKSMLINILLKKHFLACSDIPSSSTVVDIKYSDSKEIWATRWGESVEQKVDIDLSSLSQTELQERIRVYIAENRNHNNPDSKAAKFTYCHVTIKWPFDLLKHGVVLMDSPGLNESREWLTSIVEKNIPISNGTICLINSTSSVTQSLLDFLKLLQGQDHFDPESVFFVCTKIDMISLEQRQAVIDEIWNRLRSIFKTIQKDHFFVVNLHRVDKLQSYGLQDPEYGKLLTALVGHLGKSFDMKLQKSFYKISEALLITERSLNLVRRSRHKTLEERKALCARTESRFADIAARKVEFAESLLKIAQRKQDMIVRHIRQYIRTNRSKLIDEAQNIPVPEGKSSETLVELVRERTFDIVVDCLSSQEGHGKLGGRARSEFISEVQQLFRQLLVEVEDVELELFGGDFRGPIGIENDEQWEHCSTRMLKVPGYAVFGIAAVAVSLIAAVPFVAYKYVEHVKEGRRLEHIHRDPKTFCKEIASETIDMLFDASFSFNQFVAKNICNFELMANNLLMDLEERVEHYKSLMECTTNQLDFDDAKLLAVEKSYRRKLKDVAEEVSRFHLLRYQEFSVPWEDLRNMSGDSGSVITATLPSGVPVLLREVDMNRRYAMRHFYKEQEKLKGLTTECITTFYGACRHENRLYMVYETFDGTTLRNFLSGFEGCKSESDFKILLNIAQQIAEALQYVHSKGMMHRNINSESILIGANTTNYAKVIKLTDFNMSTLIDDSTGTFVGRDAYIAPEIGSKSYNEKVDIYSYGVVLWELWHCRHPFGGEKIYMEMHLQGWRPTVAEKCPHDYSALFDRCWSTDKDSRPSWSEIMEELAHIKFNYLNRTIK